MNDILTKINGLSYIPRTLVQITLTWAAMAIILFIWVGVPYGLSLLDPATAASITAPLADLSAGVQESLMGFKPMLKVSGGLILLFGPLWTGWQVYVLKNAKKWQNEGNARLAQVGVIAWLSVPPKDTTKWSTAADMWGRLRTPLLRPDRDRLVGKSLHASLEVIAIEGDGIYWLLWSPDPRELPDKFRAEQDLPDTLGGAISGYNPKVRVKLIDDPLQQTLQTEENLSFFWLLFGLAKPAHYPINTDFDGDPMMALVSNMKTDCNVLMVGLQTLIRPVHQWQTAGQQELSQMTRAQAAMNAKTISKQAKEQRLALEVKLDQFGFDTFVRVYVAGPNPQALSHRLRGLQDVMGQYQSLNSFVVVAQGQEPLPVIQRAFPPQFDPKNILNVGELAGLYHLPSATWAPIPGIKWSPAREIPPAAAAIRAWGLPAYLQQKS